MQCGLCSFSCPCCCTLTTICYLVPAAAVQVPHALSPPALQCCRGRFGTPRPLLLQRMFPQLTTHSATYVLYGMLGKYILWIEKS